MTIYKKLIHRFKIHCVKEDAFPAAKICSSSSLVEFVTQFYEDIEIYESFYVVTLNRANNITGYAKISQGGISGTVVDAKLVAKFAIESLASLIILVHNHPSGNKKPSEADIALTKKLKDGLKLLDVLVLDHVILTPEDGHYSFADEGRL